MHISLGDIGAIAGLVGLLVVIAGVLGAAFRVSKNTQTVANYRESAQSWEAKANVQAKEIEDLQRQVRLLQGQEAEKDKQLATMKEQISGLRDLLSNRAAFETLDSRLQSLDVIDNRMAELLRIATETNSGIQLLLLDSPGKAP